MDNPLVLPCLALVITTISFAILAWRNDVRASVAQRECRRMVAQQTRANPTLSPPEVEGAR